MDRQTDMQEYKMDIHKTNRWTDIHVQDRETHKRTYTRWTDIRHKNTLSPLPSSQDWACRSSSFLLCFRLRHFLNLYLVSIFLYIYYFNFIFIFIFCKVSTLLVPVCESICRSLWCVIVCDCSCIYTRPCSIEARVSQICTYACDRVNVVIYLF